MKQNKHQNNIGSITISSLSSMIFGTSLTMSSVITKGLALTSLEKSLITSSLFLGALIGTIVTPKLFKNIKNMIILSNFCYFLGNLLVRCFAVSYIMVLGRGINGFGIGIVCATVPIYLSQLALKKNQNIIGSLHQLGIVIGVFIGQILQYFLNETNKHLMLSVYVFLLLILFLLSFFIADKEIITSEDGYKILFEDNDEKSKLLTSILLHIIQQFSCINGVIIYSHEIFKDNAKINPELCTIYTGIVSLISTIFSIIFIEYFGSSFLLIVSTIIVVASLISLAFEYRTLLSIFIFIAGFNIGIGPVPWIYIGKIFNLNTRKAGVSLAVTINWLSGFIVTFLFPILLVEKMKCYLGFAIVTGSLVAITIKRL